jgi:hypothetical protein
MKTKITKKKKRKAPEKACPQCDAANHARSSNCKSCDHTFYVRKSKEQELLAANWRDLKKGDIIKVITGSGPYYLSKDKPGEKIMLGQKGRFEVSEVIDQGIRSCGIFAHQLRGRATRENVREYIYMGEQCYDDDMSVYRNPHKIKVIKKQG